MSQHSYYCGVSFVFSLLAPSIALAQDLKAWETAVNFMQDDKGCYSIPYSSPQDSCIRKQNEVNKWCKESGPFNCADVDPKQFQKDIEKLKTQRDELKSEKEKLERDKSSAKDDNEKRAIETKLKEIETKIDDANKLRGSLERQVQESTKKVNDRLAIAKGCRDARVAVQEVFKDARSSADRESDPKIVPLAKRLIAWWDPRYQSHELQVTEVKNAVGTCEKVLYEMGRLGSF